MRPSKNDHAEYYSRYIDLIPGDNIIEVLENYGDSVALMRSIPPEKENFSYSEGKWTVKQLIGHIIDTERIMAYRALRISRNDKTPLPGYEQDDYAREGNVLRRAISGLADEFEAVRNSNLHMFRTFNDEELKRRGTASGYEVTVNALLYIIAGHEMHHMKMLRERYL